MVNSTPGIRRGAESPDSPVAGAADALEGLAAHQLVAFVDESSRRLGAGTRTPSEGGRAGERIYLMAAVVCSAGACEDLRTDLRALLLRSQQRLHWRDESGTRRAKITSGIAAMASTAAMRAVVVVATPVPNAKQERARRLCLETLYPALEGLGLRTIIQERRTPQQNQRDLQMVEALRGQRLLSAAVRVQFAQPVEEPMLWLPDAIAGAVGLAREGHPDHLATLDGHRQLIQHIDIPMR